MQPSYYDTLYRAPAREPSVPPGLLVVAVLAALLAVLFRFLSYEGFTNDHYVVLARAQAMLQGDWPIRDYTEAGAPLTAALSAGAQAIVGHGLLAEVLLSTAWLGLAAGITCWAAGRLTGLASLGFAAALVQIAIFPRLYSYPKIAVYPVLFLLGWAYLRRPNGERLTALGTWTALAFLLRHDHGVYAAFGASVAIVLTHWTEGIRRTVLHVGTYALISLALVGPYLAYVQSQEGLVPYFRTGVAVSQAEASRADWILPPMAPIRRGPLLALKSRAADDLPAIAVRWQAGLSEDARRAYERQLSLRYPEIRDDGVTWRYRVDPPATQTLAQLVNSKDVADTGGFDRQSLGLDNGPSFARGILLGLNLDRITVGPPIADLFNDTNATALVFYAVWALPPLAVLLWALRRGTCMPPLCCGSEVPLLAAIAAPTIVGLVRAPNPARLPDGFGVIPILAVWVLAAAWTARPRFAVLRAAVKTTTLAAGVLFVIAVPAMAYLGEKIDKAHLNESPSAVIAHARDVWALSSTWPWKGQWPSGGGEELVPYLNRCTVPTDRLLVLWNAPHFNVFAQRAFAGGRSPLVPNFSRSPASDAIVLAHLEVQDVPIVLSDPATRPEFDEVYPQVSAFLETRYREARVFSYDGGQQIALYVDRQRQVRGVDPEFGLPCFAPSTTTPNR